MIICKGSAVWLNYIYDLLRSPVNVNTVVVSLQIQLTTDSTRGCVLITVVHAVVVTITNVPFINAPQVFFALELAITAQTWLKIHNKLYNNNC